MDGRIFTLSLLDYKGYPVHNLSGPDLPWLMSNRMLLGPPHGYNHRRKTQYALYFLLLYTRAPTGGALTGGMLITLLYTPGMLRLCKGWLFPRD